MIARTKSHLYTIITGSFRKGCSTNNGTPYPTASTTSVASGVSVWRRKDLQLPSSGSVAAARAAANQARSRAAPSPRNRTTSDAVGPSARSVVSWKSWVPPRAAASRSANKHATPYRRTHVQRSMSIIEAKMLPARIAPDDMFSGTHLAGEGTSSRVGATLGGFYGTQDDVRARRLARSR